MVDGRLSQGPGHHPSRLNTTATNFHFHAQELVLLSPLRLPYPHGQPWLYRDYPQLLRLIASE